MTLQTKEEGHRIIVSLRDEIGKKIALQLGGHKGQESYQDLRTLADRLRLLHLPPINQRELAQDITYLRQEIKQMLRQTASEVACMDL